MTTGHELVDHLFYLKPPATKEAAERMDLVRSQFIALGHHIVDVTPVSADQTVALRKLHEACMAAIATIALNQGSYSE